MEGVSRGTQMQLDLLGSPGAWPAPQNQSHLEAKEPGFCTLMSAGH